jgi:hypothetical protein
MTVPAASDAAAFEVDHVVIGVDEPESFRRRLLEQHGLGSFDSGTFPGAPGLRNWVVPMPAHYLELVGLDPAGGPLSPRAHWLAGLVSGGPRLLRWAARTPSLTALAARLRLPVEEGRGEGGEDGAEATWRLADPAGDAGTSHLPFLIEYGQGGIVERLPGLLPLARHPHPVRGISWIALRGPRAPLREILGDTELPLRFSPGLPGIDAVGVATAGGEIVLRAPL